MALLGISSDAWAGAAGAIIGGSFTLAAQVLNDHSQQRTAKKASDDLVSATAILLQDDFWHYQSMLARALDRCTWWRPGELLPAQASIEDRKTVFAALSNEHTETVAAAQGWIDYLIGCRQQLPEDTPSLDQEYADTMQMTFRDLEAGRGALANLARRRASPFSEGRVLGELTNCKTVEELLSRRCPDRSTHPAEPDAS